MTFPTTNMTRGIFLAAIAIAIIALLVVIQKRPAKPIDDSAYASPSLDFKITDFEDLQGWSGDDPQAAFSAFLLSCEKLLLREPDQPANRNEYLGPALGGVTFAGKVSDWRGPCIEAQALSLDKTAKNSAKRDFFEANFRPILILDKRAPKPDGPAKGMAPRILDEGKFTGYYEPIYRAARAADETFSAKIYPRPKDLIDVDLGQFREELSGQRIAGRIRGNRLVAYPDHRAINDGALEKAVDAIAWMAPTDLFFLQIQGSGRLRFDDGSEIRIGYAGQNGHPYTAIGRVMVEQEIMPLDQVSMQTIKAWLTDAPPAAAKRMREENASYVFFRELEAPAIDLGPPGAQGVLLTPGRSLAVDLRYHMLGAPVWVDIAQGDGRTLQRLMIAQDTGGAIRGPVRGDIFWGTGDDAGEIAGRMNASGKLYVLMPKAIAKRLAQLEPVK